MKTLTRYIGREVLTAILLIFSALVALFAFFVFAATFGTITTATRSPNPSLQYHLVFVVFPRLVRTFLVLVPMALGAHRGSQRVPLPLASTLLGVVLLAGVTFLVAQGLDPGRG